MRLLLVIIFFIFPISFAFGQEISEEFYSEVKLYEYQISVDNLTVSINKSEFVPGEQAELIGFVSDFKKGNKVIISIENPLGNIINEIRITPNDDGFFKVNNNVPNIDDPSLFGEYQIITQYENSDTMLILPIQILLNTNETFVVIPLESNFEGVKNFEPRDVTVEAGLPLVWKNNDDTVHTVVSGTLGFNNKMFSDGKFDSGTFGPGDEFRIILEEGAYEYYCKLHPWLIGSILVTPSTNENYVPPTPEPEVEEDVITKSNIVFSILNVLSNSSYTTILDDDMADLFTVWQSSDLDRVEISNSLDKHSGNNSLLVNANTTSGRTVISHDFGDDFIQNWSEHNGILFWFQGDNTGSPISLLLRDVEWKNIAEFTFIDSSLEWRPIMFKFQNDNFDFSKIKGISFAFDRNLNNEFLIDNILLIQSSGIIQQPNTVLYGEELEIIGIIKDKESDSPISLRVFDPKNNLITIDQITPITDKPSFVVEQFKKTTLIDDYLSSKFTPWTSSSNSIIEINDDTEKVSGVTSMKITSDTNTGQGSVSYDFGSNSLQNWNDFDSIAFYLKGKNSGKELEFSIRGKDWNHILKNNFVDNSTRWQNLSFTLPADISLTEVRGISFIFPQNVKTELFIDEISLVPILNPDAHFSVKLPLEGKNFEKEGVYRLSTQYGISSHQFDETFNLLIPHRIESSIDAYEIVDIGGTFYGISDNFDNFAILNSSEYLVSNSLIEIENMINPPEPELKSEPEPELESENEIESVEEIIPETVPDEIEQENISEISESNEEILENTYFSFLMTIAIVGIVSVAGFVAFTFIRKKAKTAI